MILRHNFHQRSLVAVFCLSTLVGCSTSRSVTPNAEAKTRFKPSGTIIISHSIPEGKSSEDAGAQCSLEAPALLAPLMGYFPALTYLPADNETWLEIDKNLRKVVLRKGNHLIKEIQGEGLVDLEPGEHYLQHKQKQPLWYAPDEYFKRRKLATPPAGNRLRYRRGALGRFALYPTTTFPIHCGPVWSEDVGGLKVSFTDLSSIYYMLPLGAPIVVK